MSAEQKQPVQCPYVIEDHRGDMYWGDWCCLLQKGHDGKHRHDPCKDADLESLGVAWKLPEYNQ